MQNDGSVPRSRWSLLKTAAAILSVFAASFLSACACNAASLDNFGILSAASLPEPYASTFPQNNLNYWNPCDGDSSEDSTGECTSPTGDKITWIGDSYSVGAADKIKSALSGVDLGSENPGNIVNPYHNIQGSKHSEMEADASLGGPSGLTILKEIADADNLRPYVVFALGTNDLLGEAKTTETLQKIADIVGDDTKVILTTAYTTNGNNYGPDNAAKKSFASSHDNFYVADWAAVAKPEYYVEDPIHPKSNGGYDAWVETIVGALPQNCGGGLLAGNDIPEKIWNWLYNWFKENNISGVDTSAVISGIMGNFWSESGFNPFMVGGGGNSYYGLWMKYWGYGGDELVQNVNDAVGANHFKFWGWWEDENTADRVLSEAGISQSDIDKAIDAELTILARDWGGEFIPALNNWGVADTPRGYSDLFLVTIERAVGGDSPIEDSAVSSHYSGLYQGSAIRRERADYIYNKYAGKAGSNNSSSQAKSVSSSTDRYDAAAGDCLCNTGSSGSSISINGGIKEEDAQKIADYYNSDKVPDDASAGIPVGQGCSGGNKGNCTAFSNWFVNWMTDIVERGTQPATGNGYDLAGNIASKYNLESGSQPRPWSVFSNPGGTTVQGSNNHTGIVVGVDGDEIITVEAACGGFIGHNSSDAVVFRYKPPEGLLYTYLDGHLDSAAFQEVLGSSVSGSSAGSTGSAASPVSPSNASSSVTWDANGWITGGMSGYTKEEAPDLGTSYNSGKPNKILLHYTQGVGGGLSIYASQGYAPHFTIDLKKKEVWQHHPISRPSGAVIDTDDVRDIVQIEIVGYGFYEDNPSSPGPDSKCIIPGTGGGDFTSSDYCFAKFSDEDWDYLATLLVGISKWGDENGTNIPLTSSVTWTGDVGGVRMSPSDFDSTTGVVAHMHAPARGNHNDTGNIWPLVEAAISRISCDKNSNVDSISGAKNADKQASEVGPMWFSDTDTDGMKTVLENYGDLAYRTGQVYGIPWIAIIVHGRYEDSGVNGFDAMCGAANFWGIACYNGTGAGGGSNSSNLGEGFNLYGETVHNGRYEAALQQTDPLNYLEQLGKGGWRVGDDGYVGYTSEQLSNMKRSIDALTDYINSAEGQAIVAQFGAANCTICPDQDNTTNSNDVLAAIEFVLQLANKNGSEYSTQYNDVSFYDRMLNGELPLNIDCTGTASLIMYKAYGADQRFTTFSINSNPLYEKIDKADVRPGDVFIYNGPSSPHGGIVVEANNGVVTKIFEVGGNGGRSGANNNMGYSSNNNYTIQTINSSYGEIYRYKGGSS